MIMPGYILSILFLAIPTLIHGQTICQGTLGGACIDPASHCCGGEVSTEASLCATAGPNKKCCLKEAACGEALHNLPGRCIPAGRTKCDPPYQGVCPVNKICCAPLSEIPDFVVVDPPISPPPGPPEPPGPPGPPEPPGPSGPPGPPGPTRPPNPSGSSPPPNEVVCSYAGQKDACDVMADNDIVKMSGPELVAAAFTTVGDDNSSPFDNLRDTCDGFEIQTTTSVHICKGARVCLHENVPRFLRCFRRLCGRFTIINIASDSNGPGWREHCKGNAVDLMVPRPCRNRDNEVKGLCRLLDGVPALYKSGIPGVLDVLNCIFSRDQPSPP